MNDIYVTKREKKIIYFLQLLKRVKLINKSLFKKTVSY